MNPDKKKTLNGKFLEQIPCYKEKHLLVRACKYHKTCMHVQTQSYKLPNKTITDSIMRV